MQKRIREAAEYYIRNGVGIVPISTESKKPAISWKDLYENPIQQWDYDDCNIAVFTGEPNGYVVVDCDSKDKYIKWIQHRPNTPMKVRSPRGMHFYYRHPGVYVKSGSFINAPEGFQYDVKGDRAYVLAPPSLSKGLQYSICVCKGNLRARLLRPEQLPVFDTAWRPEAKRSYTGATEEIRDASRIIKNITAIEGERDTKFFHITRICMEGKLTEAEAIQIAVDWNQTNCSPSWPVEAVVSKVRRVYAGN